jgi:hypothetical protein
LDISGDVCDFKDQFGDTDAGRTLREETFPLHFQIMNDKSHAVMSYIIEAHTNDVGSIRIPDDMGVTPVFMAAVSSNYHALETLIALGAADQLSHRSNVYKRTPLEACQKQLTDDRQFSRAFGVDDSDSEKKKLRCIAKLKRAMGMPEMDGVTDEDYAEQAKYGCTCGECTEGFLSPRMRYRLLCKSFYQVTETYILTSVISDQAEVTFDMMDDDPPSFQKSNHFR